MPGKEQNQQATGNAVQGHSGFFPFSAQPFQEAVPDCCFSPDNLGEVGPILPSVLSNVSVDACKIQLTNQSLLQHVLTGTALNAQHSSCLHMLLGAFKKE